MRQADQIRETALDNFIRPARAAGHTEIIIRAGDLHTYMKLSNAMPAVCSALRSTKFQELAGVRLAGITGPAAGANVYFRFEMADEPAERGRAPYRRNSEETGPVAPQTAAVPAEIDFNDALVLVSCVKTKLHYPAPARLLYCSDLFSKIRRLLESRDARWYILSALYGLVRANTVIAPYELTLNTMGVKNRMAWAAKVLATLEPELPEYKRVIFFAGLRYREFLVEPIRRAGLQAEVPMAGLKFGEQLSWLSARR
jgi:hypothetical protein